MALAPVTNKFVYLDDGQIALLNRNKAVVINASNQVVRVKTHEVDSNTYTSDKSGYNHFMEKEIFEQPQSASNTLESRLGSNDVLDNIFGLGSSEIFAK